MEKVKLADVCEISNGYAFKSSLYTESGLRIIRITNVKKGYIEDSEPKFYAIDKKYELSNYVLKENDLLISLTGNVGRVGLLQKEMLPAVLNQRVGCIRIKNESTLNIKYIFNMLNNKTFERACINNSKGIAQKNLSTEWLKEYEINLPNINEQEKVANELDKVQEVIYKKNKQIDDLNKLIKSQFVEMFENNNDVKYKKIVDICNSIVRGPFGSALKKESFVAKSNNTYKVYEQKNAINEDWHLGTYYINEQKYNELKRFECKPKDIIMSCSGTIGRFYQFPNGIEKGIINQALLKFTINEDIVLSRYFIDYMKMHLDELDTKGSGLQNIGSVSYIKDMDIPVPKIDLQMQYLKFAKQIDKQKFEIQKSLEETQKLQESLMNKYFG